MILQGRLSDSDILILNEPTYQVDQYGRGEGGRLAILFANALCVYKTETYATEQ